MFYVDCDAKVPEFGMTINGKTFGHDADGHMLSDHVGYAAPYLLSEPRSLAFADAAPLRLASHSAAR